jgi:hypothetical protein
MNVQKEMMLGRLPTVTPKHIYNAAAELTKKLKFKSADPFFLDPDSPQGQQIAAKAAQQPPDPKMMELQIRAQLEQQKDQRQAQLEQEKLQREAASEAAQMNADLAVQQQKGELERQMMLDKHHLEMEQSRELHAQRMAEHQATAAIRQQQAQDKANAPAVAIKHQTEDITGPMADVVGRLADHISQTHAAHTAHLAEHLTKLITAPRRVDIIKGGDGQKFARHTVEMQ